MTRSAAVLLCKQEQPTNTTVAAVATTATTTTLPSTLSTGCTREVGEFVCCKPASPPMRLPSLARQLPLPDPHPNYHHVLASLKTRRAPASNVTSTLAVGSKLPGAGGASTQPGSGSDGDGDESGIDASALSHSPQSSASPHTPTPSPSWQQPACAAPAIAPKRNTVLALCDLQDLENSSFGRRGSKERMDATDNPDGWTLLPPARLRQRYHEQTSPHHYALSVTSEVAGLKCRRGQAPCSSTHLQGLQHDLRTAMTLEKSHLRTVMAKQVALSRAPMRSAHAVEMLQHHAFAAGEFAPRFSTIKPALIQPTPPHRVHINCYPSLSDSRGFVQVYEYSTKRCTIMMDVDTSFVHLTSINNALGRAQDIAAQLSAIPELGKWCTFICEGISHLHGAWAPFDLAKAICCQIAWPLRHDLVPFFGPTFAAVCLAPTDEGFDKLNRAAANFPQSIAAAVCNSKMLDTNVLTSVTASKPVEMKRTHHLTQGNAQRVNPPNPFSASQAAKLSAPQQPRKYQKSTPPPPKPLSPLGSTQRSSNAQSVEASLEAAHPAAQPPRSRQALRCEREQVLNEHRALQLMASRSTSLKRKRSATLSAALKPSSFGEEGKSRAVAEIAVARKQKHSHRRIAVCMLDDENPCRKGKVASDRQAAPPRSTCHQRHGQESVMSSDSVQPHAGIKAPRPQTTDSTVHKASLTTPWEHSRWRRSTIPSHTLRTPDEFLQASKMALAEDPENLSLIGKSLAFNPTTTSTLPPPPTTSTRVPSTFVASHVRAAGTRSKVGSLPYPLQQPTKEPALEADFAVATR